MQTFSLHTHVLAAGRVVVTVDGELDLATAPVLEHEVERALADGAVELILDLCGLTFADCRGLTCLLSIRRRVLDHLGTLNLRNVVGQPRHLLDLTGTAAHLGLSSQVREAAG